MKQSQEHILQEYEKESSIILKKMLQLIIRAQRKVDDKAYRDALAKIQP